jgi:hypothetical protein
LQVYHLGEQEYPLYVERKIKKKLVSGDITWGII